MQLDKIEPFHSLRFDELESTSERVRIAVPLDGNRNDKGTMFGGSIYSAMVLAGWKLCGEQAAALGLGGDIVIRDSQVSFLRPVHSDLTAIAVTRGAPSRTRHGNYAFDVVVSATDADGSRCATFDGGYRLLVESQRKAADDR